MHSISVFFLAAFVGLAPPGQTANRVPVRGQVLSMSDAPLPASLRPSVVFSPMNDLTSRTEVPLDASGKFQTTLPPGSYLVDVRAGGQVLWTDLIDASRPVETHFKVGLDPWKAGAETGTGGSGPPE